LGVTTTTDDLEGEVIQNTANVNLEDSKIINSLNNFIGTIEQIPPIYSAIKKDGKKLYELARKGEQITVEPRTVKITKIDLIKIDRTNGYEIEVDINCGAGTYIRSIARDLGEKLGVGGTLASLVRTQSCGMQLDNSVTFEQIETQIQQQTFTLIEPSLVLSHLDAVRLSDRDSQLWSQGQLIDLDRAKTNKDLTLSDSYLVTYRNDIFLGISILYERNNVLKIKPKIVCV
jgi:tRNA pseudouridine55 synthase